MTSLNQNSINTLVKEIASTLDRIDDNKKGYGKGTISANTWNKVFNAKEKGGKEIREKMSVFNAEKSIKYYLNKHAVKTQEDANDIGQRWLLSLQEKDDENKVPAEKKESCTVNESNNSILTSDKLINSEIISGKDLVEQPVSTFVKKVDVQPVIAKITDDKADEYNELSTFTKSSSAKLADNSIDHDVLDNAFDNVIKKLMKIGKKTRSVLIGAAKDFVASAEKYSVDIFTLMGISMIESAYGTSKMALTKNNVGGLTPNGKTGITCQSVADSIDIAAKTLHKNVYDKGLESIDSVGMKGNYCCGGKAGRASWVRSVVSFANSIRTEYNKLLSQEQESLNIQS